MQTARAPCCAGGSATVQGAAALAELDAQMLALNASPGGAADLLAATLFLDRVSRARIQRMLWNRLHCHSLPAAPSAAKRWQAS
jgi:hypothetical protein